MSEENPENKPKEICGKSFEDLRQIISSLDDISYEMLDHPRINAILLVLRDLENWLCQERGHDWTFDQCGYWQHQFCVDCQQAKYPDLVIKRCAELRAKMGNITEEEYNASLSK